MSALSNSAQVTVDPAALNSITVTPVDPSVAKGISVQFTATGNYSDGTIQDLTQSVTWASSAPAVAMVSNAQGSQGLANTIGTGTATISASLPQSPEVSRSTVLTVTSATLSAIEAGPPSTIAVGATVQLTATGVFSDGTTLDLTSAVSWTTSDSAVAVVSDAAGTHGLVTGVSAGTATALATITATLDGVSGSAPVTVTSAVLSSITITPISPSIAIGTTQQLTATGVYSDGSTADLTNLASWTSSNTAIATVDSTGLLTGIAEGSATISAQFDGITGTTDATVTTVVLVAVEVSPNDASIAPLSVLQLTATGVFSDGSTQNLTQFANWTSDKPLVAWVSNAPRRRGRVTGLIPGTANIFANFKGLSGSASITTWISSNQSIAQVSNAPTSQGQVSGIAAGSATISAIYGGLSNGTIITVTSPRLVSITVTPVNPSLRRNSSLQMTATATYADGSTEDLTDFADWSSSDSRVASFNYCHGQNGLLFGNDTGTATVRAEYRGVSGTTRATVTR